ncbi:MAG: hypothetical protein K2F63_03205, partial [Muribaculaceae bacterium]|nr:hypothetical protein [Muribaculaceae bacterium]
SGQTIAGDVEWSASVDGVATAQGTAAAGSDVTVPFEGIATGSRTFSFTASVDGVAGEAASQTIYVGFDTPKAPANVVLGETSVSWDAVTEGVNGGYVNTAALSYTVSINGEEAGVTTDLSLPLEGIADSPFNCYRATVTARSMELTSAPAESDVLRAGQPLSLPLFMAPNASDIDLCETTDGDGDGRTWTYDAEMGAFKGSYNMDVNVDDWLILPPVEFKEGGIYYFSMEAARRYLSYPSEALEVRAGRFPTPEAMAQGETVVDFTLLESDFTEYNGTIHASEGGKWYIGIHAMSAPDQVGLYVREISVSDNGVTASSPAAVMSLWAEGAADASLKA